MSGQPQPTHHFVLTLKLGDKASTFHGAITPPRGATRTDVFNDLIATYVQAPAAVLFFSLERNQL